VILLLGSARDGSLALVRRSVEQAALSHVHLDLPQLQQAEISLEISDGVIDGHLRLPNRAIRLGDVSGVYLRLGAARSTSDGRVPRQMRTLALWCELTDAHVVTRLSAGSSNASKPYQAQLIRAQGFSVPETLVTNDPDLAADFIRANGSVVCKSISSARSRVRELAPADEQRLDAIIWCPAQLQVRVRGRNVRVHTVNGQCFATAIETEAVDYRYQRNEGVGMRMDPIDLPKELADRCLRLAEALSLPLAGIDLIVADDGTAWCLEVNTSPAFSFYEDVTGQPIAVALSEMLAGLPRGALATASLRFEQRSGFRGLRSGS
jgi:hypothetical protein